jgi:ubiquinone/menaquinone biosynthesis C-methylase UbiE
MNWTLKRWDLYAPHYDRLISFAPQRRRSIELAELRPGERILLCGCGTGLDLPLLPPGIQIDAVDLSPGMLRQALARARHSNARLQMMDAQHLGFPDASFDCVFLHLILAIVPDPRQCLREAVRVLKPNGRVALFDKYYGGPDEPRLIRRILNPLTKILATDLNVPLPRLAAEAGLHFVREESALLAGLFRVARLERKTPVPSSAG